MVSDTRWQKAQLRQVRGPAVAIAGADCRVRPRPKESHRSYEGTCSPTHQSRATDGAFVVKELAGMSDWAASICARRLSSGSLEMVLARAVS
jgi:hypothetical protein